MGLNDYEVVESRKKYGSNMLTKKPKNSFWGLLLESFSDPIIKILLIALAIKIVFLFKSFDWFETLGILIAVFLASFISTISEYGSEAAFLKLQNESDSVVVKVIRNSKLKEIPIEEVVVNDIIVLNSGDRVPADAVLIENSLSVDESLLNGESKDILKVPKVGNIKDNNRVYRGSVVFNGNAKAKVLTVGDKTIYGKISQELQDKNSESPLKAKLRELAATISKVGYVGAALAAFAYLFMEIIVANSFNLELILNTITNWPLMFDYLLYALTLSVTIIVVAVPEGLPMMITLVLSSNMKRMLKDKVLVRKLVGIETAGRMNFLLTDKTGTLTQGQMKVIDYISIDGKKIKDLKLLSKELQEDIIINCYYNNESLLEDGHVIGGNITDRAIKEFVKKELVGHITIKKRVFFDSVKKYSSITTEKKEYLKGAYEVLKSKCTLYQDSTGQKHPLYNFNQLDKQIKGYAAQGYRVLILVTNESGIYTYQGLLRIKDKIRNETIEGLNLIKKAGINTIMITGDNKETSMAIAKEIGLLDNNSLVWDSKHFNELSDEEIRENIYQVKVIARSMPQDKSRLVNIIKDMNLVVGMTGDGINDAPALKKADVGFAMGSGSEIAKEASDIVILDDNILSISKAVLYGRTIFKSIRKFIIYQLGVNTCALIISIVGTLIGIQNPITIIQMLWLNMIMDTFSGLAFSFEPPLLEYMEEPPKNEKEKIMNKYMYSEIIVGGVYSSVLCILFLKLPIFNQLIRTDINNRYLMTAYFAMFIFIGIVNAYNARTSRINVFANILKNKVFLIIFSLITITQIYIIYYGGEVFRTYGLNTIELLYVMILSLTAFPVDVIRKYCLKKKNSSVGV